MSGALLFRRSRSFFFLGRRRSFRFFLPGRVFFSPRFFPPRCFERGAFLQGPFAPSPPAVAGAARPLVPELRKPHVFQDLPFF